MLFLKGDSGCNVEGTVSHFFNSGQGESSSELEMEHKIHELLQKEDLKDTMNTEDKGGK